jgi:hypothetical protein
MGWITDWRSVWLSEREGSDMASARRAGTLLTCINISPDKDLSF